MENSDFNGGRAILRGAVFDLDGTLVTQDLDFAAIRREIGLPVGQPLLEALDRMSGRELEAAAGILDRHERAAAASAILNPGVAEFVTWLAELGVKKAVLSRNSRRSVQEVLGRCGLEFDLIVAREDAPYKPDPAGIIHICSAWGVHPAEVAMIGDYLYDVQAGRHAGARTALITHGRDRPFAHLADVTFPNFEELPDLLRGWFAPSA
jgi:HAD superfamily hydrolase (TIGR01509 family)